ncbi:MAG: hypothetical protein KatS3mg060_3546 [Dehalococcoidia bacterium]|nr:MAG: hypothetical protein KatS3mg060_3546 [Dehalococcoidia bacterium]
MTTQLRHIPMAREDRPQYFDDPAVDRLLQMLLELAAELWAVKDWQFVVNRLLEQRGVLTLEDVQRYQPTEDDQKLLAVEREKFVHRFIKHISPTMEPLKYE